MKGFFVIDGDLFPGFNVAQSKEEHVTVKCFHVSVRPARVVDIVRAIPAAAAIQTPAAIDVTDAQLGPTGPALGFKVRDSFTGVLGDLSPALEKGRGKTASAIDCRFPDREACGQLELHPAKDCRRRRTVSGSAGESFPKSRSDLKRAGS